MTDCYPLKVESGKRQEKSTPIEILAGENESSSEMGRHSIGAHATTAIQQNLDKWCISVCECIYMHVSVFVCTYHRCVSGHVYVHTDLCICVCQCIMCALACVPVCVLCVRVGMCVISVHRCVCVLPEENSRPCCEQCQASSLCVSHQSLPACCWPREGTSAGLARPGGPGSRETRWTDGDMELIGVCGCWGCL